MAKTPSQSKFHFERELLQRGCTTIAGVDEAGRGPLAGPVVAAAVIFPREWILEGLPHKLRGLNDSKQLTEAQREEYFAKLIACPEVRHAVVAIDSTVIDEINILQATFRAMNGALDQLSPAPAHVLVDGKQVSSARWPQTPLVKGDARSYSIAAASVIAKVTRDRLMMDYDRMWPHYGFAGHKGYGTEEHLAAIRQHGPCLIHRRSFAPLKPSPLPATELFDSLPEQMARTQRG